MMNINAMRQILATDGISPNAYSVNQDRDDMYCLVKVSTGDWLVYFSERGHHWDERIFASEDAACNDLIERLRSDSTTRVDYQGPIPP
jgi:hypothetical protein